MSMPPPGQYPGPYPPYQGGYPPPYPPPMQVPTTNGMAIASLVCSFFSLIGGILGIIFGCVAIGQINRNGQAGKGMAIAGICIGTFWVVLFVVIIILAVVFANQHPSY